MLHADPGKLETNFALNRNYLKKGGDRQVRIFFAQNHCSGTPEVSLLLPYQRSAEGVGTMYYFKIMHSKSLKCAK